MRIGVHISAVPDTGPQGLSIERFAGVVKLCDELGFSRVTTGDNQGNNLESITALTYMATITRRIHVGPHVTNPMSRHPGVAAAALASLDLISEGRTFFVLGTGDAAVRNLGLTPARRTQLEGYLQTVRDLLTVGYATYEGASVRMPWPGPRKGPIPLYVAAEGPRMLRLAGEIADGVYVGTGLSQDVVSDALNIVRQAADRSGNRLAPVDIWWGTRSAVAPTRQEALVKVKDSLANAGNHALRGDHDAKRVPQALRAGLNKFHTLYDYKERGRRDKDSANVRLMDELGLTEFFLDRFALVGTPDDIVERLRKLETWGVQQVVLHARTVEDVRLIGQHVLPRVATPA